MRVLMIGNTRLPVGRRSARLPGRRLPDPRRRRRIGASALLLAAVGGIGWLIESGVVARQIARLGDAWLALSAGAGFTVDDVLVEGRRRTTRGEVLEVLGVTRDVPIFGFDPHVAKARLEGLPWVRRAEVERRLPHVIYVRLLEREPMAIWQHDGRLAVIDLNGVPIRTAEPAAFAELPLVVGEDAPAHAAVLLAMLAEQPEINAKVVAAVRVRGRRWNLRLDEGIDVRLPEDNPGAAWAELARIQRAHGLLGRDVVMIDLRMPDRLVVRTAPGALLVPPRDGGKET